MYQALRAVTLARAGEFPKAAAELDVLAKRRNLTGDTYFEMARAAALCSTSVGEKEAARAVEWLNEAANGGYFRNRRNLQSLYDSADFEAIRKRADFEALVKNLAKS
jgi:hypothetical protein